MRRTSHPPSVGDRTHSVVRPPTPEARHAPPFSSRSRRHRGRLGPARRRPARARPRGGRHRRRPRRPARPPSPTSPTCWTGQDDNGAYYAMAVPQEWNGDLVVHAHGGPDLGDASDPARSLEDLDRWSVMVARGLRLGGLGLPPRRLRHPDGRRRHRERPPIFVGDVRRARPDATRTASRGAATSPPSSSRSHPTSYDGALLTNGVLAGGSRGYDYRVDLRVVYQYYCGNHPRPTEPQYPLWMGLREGSTMTSAGLRARLQECTGYQSDPADRTALQQRNLDDILAVTQDPRAHPGVAPALRDLHLPRHRARPARRPEPVLQPRASATPAATTTRPSTPASSGSPPTRPPGATCPGTATSPARSPSRP